MMAARLLLIITIGLIPSLVFAPAVGAGGPVLKTSLVVIAGEDPSVPNDFQFDGDAQFSIPPVFQLDVIGLDPARFPAGPACNVEVRAGAIDARGLMLKNADPAPADPENIFLHPVTKLEFQQAGITLKAGDRVEVRIRCEFIGATGVRERHETRLAGTLAAV